MKTRGPIVASVTAAITCAYTFAAWGQATDRTSEPIEWGYLIVDGRPVHAPYVFRTQDGVVSVNDIELDPASLDDRDYEGEGRGWRRFHPHGSPGRFAERPVWRNPWRRIAENLENRAIVVVRSNQKPVSIPSEFNGFEFLKLLCDEQARRQAVDGPLPWLPDEVDEVQWREWIVAFEPTHQFLARARADIEEMERTQRSNMAEVNAIRRLDASAYPLTALGMLLVVLATGHLLSHRPETVAGGAGSAVFSPETNRLVCRSLVFVFMLSGLDLVWTVLVSQTGSMRELNPLGSLLIENPEHLIAFKLSATTLAVGLLFAVRRSPFAQRASWWMCLVCTLLTARWLTFNSMHVA